MKSVSDSDINARLLKIKSHKSYKRKWTSCTEEKKKYKKKIQVQKLASTSLEQIWLHWLIDNNYPIIIKHMVK